MYSARKAFRLVFLEVEMHLSAHSFIRELFHKKKKKSHEFKLLQML